MILIKFHYVGFLLHGESAAYGGAFHFQLVNLGWSDLWRHCGEFVVGQTTLCLIKVTSGSSRELRVMVSAIRKT